MLIERFERNGISFPSICLRCGSGSPTRVAQLILPYRAWLRSNPVIKAPVCANCFVVLGLQEWISFVLMLGASLASIFYIPRYVLGFLTRTEHHLFHAQNWLATDGFIEVVVYAVLLGTFYFFGHYRDRFLRRDHLKVKITDYGNDWVELEASDDHYFGKLLEHSQMFSVNPRGATPRA